MLKRLVGLRIFLLFVAGLTIQTHAAEKIGDWTYVEQADPLTDKVLQAIYIYEMNGAANVRLRVACSPSFQKSFGYDFGGLMVGSRNTVMIQYRVDSEPASGNLFPRLFNGNRSANINLEMADKLAIQMQHGETLFIRVTDIFDNTSKDHYFSLSGFAEAFEKVICKR